MQEEKLLGRENLYREGFSLEIMFWTTTDRVLIKLWNRMQLLAVLIDILCWEMQNAPQRQ